MKKVSLMIAALVTMTLICCCSKDDNKKEEDKKQEKVEVTLTVDESPITIDCLGDVFNIDVTCNVASKATVDYGDNSTENWISLSPEKLSGNGTYRVSVSEYTSPLAPRQAEIVITADDKTARVSITQTPKESVSLAVSTVVALDNERTYSVDVTSNAAWKAQTSYSWITVLKGEGEAGTNKLQIKVTAIGENPRRDGSVVITSGSTGAILNVSQGYGVLIGGLIWSKYNINDPGTFVEDIEEIGKVYCYDSKQAWPIVGFNDFNKEEFAAAKGCPAGYPVNTAYAGEDTWQPENDPCPDGWRIPTADEMWALIGGSEAPNWHYHFYYWNQGAFCGSADAVNATNTDMKGCIFIPFAGFRKWEDGVQPEADRVWVQTITRPDHNWGRVCFVFNWTEAMGTWNADNNNAMAIRPVADLIEE